MTTALSALVALLFALGVYLLLSRHRLQALLGLALIGNAVNLLILTGGSVSRGGAPLVPKGAGALAAPFANPVPQALILTAIVIGFGLLSFTLVLLERSHRALGTMDSRQLARSNGGTP